MDKWHGKVALVTGASAGIGANITKALANAGMIVIGLGRRVDAIEALKSEISNGSGGKIVERKCDVTDDAQLLLTFKWIKEEFGRLDVLVNNAGVIKSDLVLDGHSCDYRHVFDVNVIAACACIREAVKLMRENGSFGHIIVLNSVLGHRIPDVPMPLFNVYPASKYALTALSQTIRQELVFHRANIKLTSISPGMVDTDFLNVYDSTVYAQLPKLNPTDVTAAVLYALSTPEFVQVEEIILQAMFRGNE